MSTAGSMHTPGLCKGGLWLRTQNTGLLCPKKGYPRDSWEWEAGPEHCKTSTTWAPPHYCSVSLCRHTSTKRPLLTAETPLSPELSAGHTHLLKLKPDG